MGASKLPNRELGETPTVSPIPDQVILRFARLEHQHPVDRMAWSWEERKGLESINSCGVTLKRTAFVCKYETGAQPAVVLAFPLIEIYNEDQQLTPSNTSSPYLLEHTRAVHIILVLLHN